MSNRTLTGIRGLRVGHYTDSEAETGCTVILAPDEGAVASASFLGPSPGTREGILLAPEKSVQKVHGLLFTGGSAFGLAAADGVVRWLAERGVGHPTPVARVPIVPAAVIYDLVRGNPEVRPIAENGYQAAASASEEPVLTGRVGAGSGATAGKYVEPVPSGLGSSLVEHREVRVGALAVVNPVGDVTTPGGELLLGHGRWDAFLDRGFEMQATTLVAVGIEAPVSKAAARQLANAAQAALARVIRPSHTPWDGDACFVLSTGAGPEVHASVLSALVQEAVERAVVGAVPDA